MLKLTAARLNASLFQWNGSECCYYEVTARTGVKLYKYKWNRDIAYDNQRRLARAGLAPAVRGRFAYEGRFGYQTQVARRFVCEDTKLTISMINNLAAKATKILGSPVWDLRRANVGYVGRRLVLIDCGPNTSSPE